MVGKRKEKSYTHTHTHRWWTITKGDGGLREELLVLRVGCFLTVKQREGRWWVSPVGESGFYFLFLQSPNHPLSPPFSKSRLAIGCFRLYKNPLSKRSQGEVDARTRPPFFYSLRNFFYCV